MIAHAVLAVLITKAISGAFAVAETPSMHACEEARCVALQGMTCAQAEAARSRALVAERTKDATWVREHPKQVAQCEAKLKGKSNPNGRCTGEIEVSLVLNGYFSFGAVNGGWGQTVPDSYVVNAWCAK